MVFKLFIRVKVIKLYKAILYCQALAKLEFPALATNKTHLKLQLQKDAEIIESQIALIQYPKLD